MKRWIPRSIAILLCLTALTGIGLSVSGLIVVHKIGPLALAWGTEQIHTAQSTFTSLDDALVMLDSSLQTAAASLQSTNDTLRTSAQTLGDTQPMLSEIQTLLDENIPRAITETQTALYTAQQGVAVIEQTLRLITLIPFMPGEPYQPQTSLSDSLGQIAATLGEIPQNTASLSGSVQISKANLAVLEINLLTLSLQMDDIQKNLQSVQEAVPQYRRAIAAQQTQLGKIGEQLPGLLKIIAGALNAFLVWLFLTQFALLLQGMDWWRRGTPPPDAH
ncbi:MAG: hypothetical protein Fur0018_20160 [Anaerolineales bacterium]